MNRKITTAFAAVCIAAALGAAASVAYRVLAARDEGRAAAKADFDGLRSLLAGVKGAADLADPGLRARLAARFESSKDLLLADVYERGSGDRWRIPAQSPYLPQAGAGSTAPAPSYPPLSTLLLSSPLKGDDSGQLALDALYVTLTQAQAFEPFRDALIGLGSFLALAAIALAIAMGGSPRRDEGELSAKEDGTPDSVSERAAAAAHYQYETMVGEDEGEDDEFDIPILAEALSGPAPAVEEAPIDEAKLVPIGRIARPAPQAEAEAARPETAAGSSGDAREGERPEGLYSPASGLGWEEYMRERLGAEISRSASFEQDLSLLAFAYDGLGKEDPRYAAIGAAIKEFFSFRDLAFELGPDGFSVILPNIDSSHALRMAEEFHKKLAFLAGGDPEAVDSLPIHMGISSRAGRLVDARRLSEEAEAALERARFERDSRIVAFRPDPDKYRLFLASKGA
jgi:hypothetical protein